ncbi:MAG: urea ABC transporter permease subunit UrtB [Pseudomonadota bacterium]
MFFLTRICLFLSVVVLATGLAMSPGASAASFEDAVARLSEKSFSVKEQAIADITVSGDERALSVLTALNDGTLYFRRDDKRIVFTVKQGREFVLTDMLSGEALGTVRRRAVRKVSINNRLRAALKGAIGSLRLFADDPGTRLTAARAMLSNPTADALPILQRALEREEAEDVRSMLGLALSALKTEIGSEAERIEAVQALSGSMNPDVWQVLGRLAAGEDAVAAEARSALEIVESRKRLFSLLETLFFGISLGAVLLLAAVGLAITFGVMGVINMAHGEMLMIGAYTTFVVQQLMPNAIEYSLFVAIPAAFIVTGLIGIAMERGIIRVLYGRPLETLLATFGISLILQQAVRTIFSPLNQPVITPDWMSGFYEVNGALSLTYNRMCIIVFCLVVFAVLVMILRMTPLGLQMRAVTQNRAMASSMGINTGWVDAMTFGLGSGIAGIGGVALSQLTNVGPNLGQAYIIDSFMVVVFGGVGNLWGTLVGAMTLGVVNKFLEPFTGAVVAKILVLVFIILFIQRRPRGLFALKGRAAEA